jgi:hypothetical protein
MNPSPAELLASVFFGLAVLHTFCVKRFTHWAHPYRPGSLGEHGPLPLTIVAILFFWFLP